MTETKRGHRARALEVVAVIASPDQLGVLFGVSFSVSFEARAVKPFTLRRDRRASSSAAAVLAARGAVSVGAAAAGAAAGGRRQRRRAERRRGGGGGMGRGRRPRHARHVAAAWTAFCWATSCSHSTAHASQRATAAADGKEPAGAADGKSDQRDLTEGTFCVVRRFIRYGAFCNFALSAHGWASLARAARRGAARNPSKPNISPSCWRLPACAAHATGFYRSAAASCFVRSCSRLLVARRYSFLWVGVMGVWRCHARQA